MVNVLPIIGGLLAAAALIGGHYWGIAVHWPGRPPTGYTNLAYFSGALMFAGIPVSLLTPPRQFAEARTKACIGAFLYSAAVVMFEPFLMVKNAWGIVVAYLVLLPLLWAIVSLARVHGWISVVGIALFVYTCSAMITSNLRVSDAGSGFFSWWTR